MPELISQVDEKDGILAWTSEELLGTCSDVVIVHKGERYHLKKTKNDRLILMK